jgi:hypothetical protein
MTPTDTATVDTATAAGPGTVEELMAEAVGSSD